MAAEIQLSFKPFPEWPADEQVHNLGNIADTIWKDKMYLRAGRIENGRYIAAMVLRADRGLRKKEKDILLEKLKAVDFELDAKVKN